MHLQENTPSVVNVTNIRLVQMGFGIHLDTAKIPLGQSERRTPLRGLVQHFEPPVQLAPRVGGPRPTFHSPYSFIHTPALCPPRTHQSTPISSDPPLPPRRSLTALSHTPPHSFSFTFWPCALTHTLPTHINQSTTPQPPPWSLTPHTCVSLIHPGVGSGRPFGTWMARARMSNLS